MGALSVPAMMGDTASDPACRGAGKRGETVPIWHRVVRKFSPFRPRYKAGCLLNENRRVENANAPAPASPAPTSLISDRHRRPRTHTSRRLARVKDAGTEGERRGEQRDS